MTPERHYDSVVARLKALWNPTAEDRRRETIAEIAAAVLDEREECASLALLVRKHYTNDVARDACSQIASLIRTRT
jgi:hypothetical protein